jgi:lysophospholipase L1-like esterase
LGVFPRSEKATDPVRAKLIDVNKTIAALESSRVTFLDFGAKFLNANGDIPDEMMRDKLHLSPQGYQIWADSIQPIVDKYLPRASSHFANGK